MTANLTKEQRDWLTLVMVPGVGTTHFIRLLARFHTPGAVLGSSVGALREVVGPALAERIIQYADVADVAGQERLMAQCAATLITLEDPDYPLRLAEIYDPPAGTVRAGRTAPLRSVLRSHRGHAPRHALRHPHGRAFRAGSSGARHHGGKRHGQRCGRGPPTAALSKPGAEPLPYSAAESMWYTRRRTPTSCTKSRSTAAWCRSSRWARNRRAAISRTATASSAALLSAHW